MAFPYQIKNLNHCKKGFNQSHDRGPIFFSAKINGNFYSCFNPVRETKVSWLKMHTLALLTLSSSAFEKGRKVFFLGGGLAPQSGNQ